MMTEALLPTVMKAWQYVSTKGGLEKNLKINSSVALPKATQDKHVVQIIAVALNPVDFKPAEVQLVSRFAIPKPATPGLDFVGRIVTPASGSSFKPGQVVFGIAGSTPFAGGTLSQFALVEKESAVGLPDGMDAISAATIGTAGLTAYQTIVPHVKAGDKIFINGGSGGTGVFGIQIAKAIGCYVATTCSGANVELCKRLGADEVVDYTKDNVTDALKANGQIFDHIVDNVGSGTELYMRCHEYTNPQAIYIQVAASPSLAFMRDMLKMMLWPGFLGGGKRKITGFFAKPVPDELEQIGAWMQQGKIKPVVEERFDFEKVPEAFTKLKLGRTKGKIVIDVDLEEIKKLETKQ